MKTAIKHMAPHATADEQSVLLAVFIAYTPHENRPYDPALFLNDKIRSDLIEAGAFEWWYEDSRLCLRVTPHGADIFADVTLGDALFYQVIERVGATDYLRPVSQTVVLAWFDAMGPTRDEDRDPCPYFYLATNGEGARWLVPLTVRDHLGRGSVHNHPVEAIGQIYAGDRLIGPVIFYAADR